MRFPLDCAIVLQHLATSKNSHCIMTDPSNRFAYVPCIAEASGYGNEQDVESRAHYYLFVSASVSVSPSLSLNILSDIKVLIMIQNGR